MGGGEFWSKLESSVVPCLVNRNNDTVNSAPKWNPPKLTWQTNFLFSQANYNLTERNSLSFFQTSIYNKTPPKPHLYNLLPLQWYNS